MTTQTPTHCDGCDRKCAYDYFTRTCDKSIFPVIGKTIIQKYRTIDGHQIYISSDQIRTGDAALKLAQKISSMCRHHRNNATQHTK